MAESTLDREPISKQKLRKHHVVDLVNGCFSPRRTTAADLANIFQNLGRASDKQHLVVHFHGGLVSRRSALDAAQKLFGTYRSAGAYPLFFVWNSDPVSTLFGNLNEIAKEPVFRRMMSLMARFLAGKLLEAKGERGEHLLLPSPKQMPQDLSGLKTYLDTEEAKRSFLDPMLRRGQLKQLEREMRRDSVLRNEAEAIAQAMLPPELVGEAARAHRTSRGRKPIQASSKSLMSRSVINQIARQAPRPGERGVAAFSTLIGYAVQITRAVLKRYRKGRDHGLYTTIIEEILRSLYLDNVGQLCWELIKGDTRDAFGGDPEKHGGTAFIQQLKTASSRLRRVSLLGHSTGAIYIANLLEHADSVLPRSNSFDVAFFAPACSFALLHERLGIFKKRVDNVRSFGLSDVLEHGYWEIPGLYDASLLYLVSGVLEKDGADTPLVGMERFFDPSRYPEKKVRDVVAYFNGESLWSVVDRGDGRRSAAKRHAGFEREQMTMSSQGYFLAHGF